MTKARPGPATLVLACLAIAVAACSPLFGVDFDDAHARPERALDPTMPASSSGGFGPTSVDGGAPVPSPDDPTACASCTVAHGTPSCAAGVCGIAACDSSRADCNGLAADGCEASLASPDSCGACGVVCPSTRVCSAGACVLRCAASETECGRACVNLTSDADHCGGCATACVAPLHGKATCSASACDFTCDPGYVRVGKRCEAETSTEGSVSVGDDHACGIRVDGTVVCWGKNQLGQASPPPGVFRAISAGNFYTCGIREDQTLACWGSNADGKATPPTGKYLAVSAGNQRACAITTDDLVKCWGEPDEEPTPFRVKSLSVGFDAACALTKAGNLRCWGANADLVDKRPDGRMRSVSVGSGWACAVESQTGELVCWGSEPSKEGSVPAPTGAFATVDLGDFQGCARDARGALSCFGYDADNQLLGTPDLVRSVSTGMTRSCAVRLDGSVACWGVLGSASDPPPGARF